MENSANKQAMRNIKTTVIDINKANKPVPPPGKSKKIYDEPFSRLIKEGKII